MQLSKFLKLLKEYYGEYNKTVETVLADYFIENFHEDELNNIFKLITDNYTNVYKIPPDKAKIMEIIKDYNSRYTYEPEKKLGLFYYEKYILKKIENKS